MRVPAEFSEAWRETAPVDHEQVGRICFDIERELRYAEKLHPGWPDDPMQQACIISEEAGEVCKEACELVYRDKTLDDFEKELRQTAAVCIRALAWTHEARTK